MNNKQNPPWEHLQARLIEHRFFIGRGPPPPPNKNMDRKSNNPPWVVVKPPSLDQ